MPSPRISKELNSGTYFLTFTVKNWYYVLDRHNRFEILCNAIKYYQENKELKLHAYVFMINHIHLIVSSPDAIAFVRDFKRYTSLQLQKNIIASDPGLIQLFLIDGKWDFWQDTNMPKMVESEKYFLQKADYIHNNPVRRQYVQDSSHWFWSSANPDSPIKIEHIET